MQPSLVGEGGGGDDHIREITMTDVSRAEARYSYSYAHETYLAGFRGPEYGQIDLWAGGSLCTYVWASDPHRVIRSTRSNEIQRGLEGRRLGSTLN